MLVTILLFTTALSLSAGQQTAPSSDELLKREQQRVDVFVSGKVDQIAAMLSPTLTYTHSSGAIDNKDAFVETLRSGKVVYRALKHSDVQVRFPTPDVAVLNGISDVSVTVDGKPQEVPLRFTIVYVKKGGAWLMEVWHATRRPS